jgi:hypothetical protein
MRKTMSVVAALGLLAAPALASAQSNQVQATATVLEYAQLSGSGNLAFGTLSAAVNNVIDAAGGAGAALRTLDFNHDVSVTFTAPANLTAGGASLPVQLMCASRIGAGSWSSASECGTAQFDLDVGAAVTQATLGFGGSIAAADVVVALAGDYTGTIEIFVVAR